MVGWLTSAMPIYIIAFPPALSTLELFLMSLSVNVLLEIIAHFDAKKKSETRGEPHAFAFHKAQRSWVNVHYLFR